MWITLKIHVKHGVLSPNPVDNHVENVDFAVDHELYIHSDYTFFATVLTRSPKFETNVHEAAIMQKSLVVTPQI